MSGSNREDFSPIVRLTLGQRVNYLCSNPACHEFTSGPHSDDDKPLLRGIAAHICAASPGGPRYDSAQTTEERKSITNGIWLCDRHAREVDNDPERFPAPLLREWKESTESFVAGGNPAPCLPQVCWRTIQGHRLILGRPITAANQHLYRDHELVIENPSRLELRDVLIRIQFPENLFEFACGPDLPFSTSISVRVPQVTVTSIPFDGPDGPGTPWNLVPHDPATPRPIRQLDMMSVTISRLPALQRIELTFVSVPSPNPDTLEAMIEKNLEKRYWYCIRGSFAFDWNKEVRHLNTWTHLKYDPQTRRALSSATLDSIPEGNHVHRGGGFFGGPEIAGAVSKLSG